MIARLDLDRGQSAARLGRDAYLGFVDDAGNGRARRRSGPCAKGEERNRPDCDHGKQSSRGGLSA